MRARPDLLPDALERNLQFMPTAARNAIYGTAVIYR